MEQSTCETLIVAQLVNTLPVLRETQRFNTVWDRVSDGDDRVDIDLLGSIALWTCNYISTFPRWAWRQYVVPGNFRIYLKVLTVLQPQHLSTGECVWNRRCWGECLERGRHTHTKRDEVTGGWRKLHNEELHNLYFSLDIVRMINQGGWSERGMGYAWGRWGMRTKKLSWYG
jgi:hypothetical protein